MTAAALFIYLVENSRTHALFQKYMREGEEEIGFEEFVLRATLPDIVAMRVAAMGSFLALGLLSIAQVWKL